VPETTFDRLVVLIGACIVAGLIALILPAWREYDTAGEPSETEAAPQSTAPSTTQPTAPSTTQATRSSATPAQTGPRTPPTRSRPAAPAPTASSAAAKGGQPTVARLTLIAANGDCWVEARSDSATGRQLYYGMLAQGERVTVSGRVVWLRLGAPNNLVARVGTKPISNLPAGAATVVATRAGLRTVSLG
jgi:cytoskeletal protein RodZ